MGTFDGVLLCTDLDGTLYKNDKTISRENKEAIAYFKQEGGYFTFVTGRMPYYTQDAFEAAQPNVPYGCVNGGGLYDGVKKEYVWTCELPTAVMELVKHIDECMPLVGIQLCGFEKTYFLKENGATKRFRRITGVPNLVCSYDSIKEPIAKIIFCSESNEEIAAIEQTLKDQPLSNDFAFVRSEKTLFEILPKGVNKGLALSKLADRLHIDVKRTVAVGDYNNDIGMFLAAGIGIAVSNACQEALDAADFITVSNEEHAIAQIIRDIERGKYGLLPSNSKSLKSIKGESS